MRTDDQIVDRIEDTSDPFGFEVGDLMEVLPVERLKTLVKAGTDLSKHEPRPRDRDSIVALIKDYMPFAWDKANNCRGLSAMRSLSHFKSWVWLAGDDELLTTYNHFDNYTHYGKPYLVGICEHYKIEWRPLDDGHWKNDEYDDGVPAASVLDREP